MTLNLHRMVGKRWLGLLLMMAGGSAGATGLLRNVPEAAGYKLVYELPIPVIATNYNVNPVPYSVDNAASIKTGSFDRVAYYMELVTGGSVTQWVYVSMTAFTTNAARLGVPRLPSGVLYHYPNTYDTAAPSNATVLSNVGSITNGTGINTISLEFWPSNYTQVNANNVPNASALVFDFGDGGYNVSDGHGSMQVHNYGAKQTLFGFSAWGGSTRTCEMGIGNQVGGNSNLDWTLTANAGSYTLRTLQVLVRPTLYMDNLRATNVTDSAGWINASLRCQRWTPFFGPRNAEIKLGFQATGTWFALLSPCISVSTPCCCPSVQSGVNALPR